MTLGKDHFADKRCADRALPRVPLGKGFAESRIAFAESLWLSAKPPYAVVYPHTPHSHHACITRPTTPQIIEDHTFLEIAGAKAP